MYSLPTWNKNKIWFERGQRCSEDPVILETINDAEPFLKSMDMTMCDYGISFREESYGLCLHWSIGQNSQYPKKDTYYTIGITKQAYDTLNTKYHKWEIQKKT